MRSPVVNDLRRLAIRSPREGRGRSAAIALCLGFSLLSATVQASEEQECSAAYDQLQVLRREGKFLAAREQVAICMRDACASFIRADANKWFAELQARQPSVLLDVRDEAGKQTGAASIALDGKPWLDKLDGTAKEIDPGEHTLHVSLDNGAPAIDQTVQILEGEKQRVVSVSFQKSAPVATPIAPTAPVLPAPAPKIDTGPGDHSMAPWIFGGVGVAGLALGGILTGVLVSEKATTKTYCTDTCNNPTGRSAADTFRTLSPITTVGFIVGGLGVGTSVVLFLTRPPPKGSAPIASLSTGPFVTAGSGRWYLQGSW